MPIEFMGVIKKYDFYVNGHIYSTYNGVDFYGAGIRTVKEGKLLDDLRKAYEFYV